MQMLLGRLQACVCLMSMCPTSKRARKNLFHQIFTKDLNFSPPQNILHRAGGASLCAQGRGERGTEGGTSGMSRTQMKEGRKETQDHFRDVTEVGGEEGSASERELRKGGA